MTTRIVMGTCTNPTAITTMITDTKEATFDANLLVTRVLSLQRFGRFSRMLSTALIGLPSHIAS